MGKENWKNEQYGLKYNQICLENWLNEENGQFYQNPSFIAFGHGRRDCIGKQLALKEMRVILGYLLLHYNFSIEEKFMNQDKIPCKGGQNISVCKPEPEIPLIVETIQQ